MAAVPGARFSISRQPIQWGAYRRFAIVADQITPPPGVGDDHPARVTWKEAMDYAAWLSRQTGAGYRVPTESEWEEATRSGIGASDPGGEDREWTCSEYRPEYQGQERRCANSLPEAVAIRGGRWRAGADPLSADLGFRLARDQ